MIDSKALLAFLEGEGIPFELEEHAEVMSMRESAGMGRRLTGIVCKTLLLRDVAGALFVVSTPADGPVDMKALASALGSRRLSFASPDVLYEKLGVRPGSLSPLALVNDPGGAVSLFLDTSLRAAPRFLYHPMYNGMTVALDADAFFAFLEKIGHSPQWCDVRVRATSAVADADR